MANLPSRAFLGASFGRFDEINHLVEKASDLTPKIDYPLPTADTHF